MKEVTLLFLRRETDLGDGEVLLAMKKRGFGEGKWNGVGGKLEPGETPVEAAIRECQEEIDVTPQDLKKVGEIAFRMTHQPQHNHLIHVFTTEQWEGEPRETEEMHPQWFAEDVIPYDDMWPADKRWLPVLLDDIRFTGEIAIGPHDRVVSYDLHEVL